MASLWESFDSSIQNAKSINLSAAMGNVARIEQDYQDGNIGSLRYYAEGTLAKYSMQKALAMPGSARGFLGQLFADVSLAISSVGPRTGKGLRPGREYAQADFREGLSKDGKAYYANEFGLKVKTVGDLADAIKSGKTEFGFNAKNGP